MVNQRFSLHILVIIILTASLGVALTGASPALAETGQLRHLGYGINIAPHVKGAPAMVAQLGFDWVKIYDLGQASEFPDRHILYRTDVRGYPSNITSWEREMANLASQLRKLGVDAVEIGNEPNLTLEWDNQIPDARRYADVLCRGYRIFKKTAPDVVVVSAGLAPTITTPDGRNITDLDYAQQMLNAGAGRCFDAWGYHPYGFDQPPESDPSRHELTFRRAERMVQLLWDNGLRDRQVWLTEFGWVRNPAEEGLNCRNEPNFKDFQWMIVSKETQADYLVRAYQFADANWPWAGPMFLWNLNWQMYEPSYELMCSHLRWYSILQPGGKPLPAYTALQQMVKNPPAEYAPSVGIRAGDMSRVVEAGCAGITDMGTFTVVNSGYPGRLNAEVRPANGPGVPSVWTSTYKATNDTQISVLVDAKGFPPGLYMVGINVRSTGTSRMTSTVVQGWLMIQYPTTPECVKRYKQQAPTPAPTP